MITINLREALVISDLLNGVICLITVLLNQIIAESNWGKILDLEYISLINVDIFEFSVPEP